MKSANICQTVISALMISLPDSVINALVISLMCVLMNSVGLGDS